MLSSITFSVLARAQAVIAWQSFIWLSSCCRIMSCMLATPVDGACMLRMPDVAAEAAAALLPVLLTKGLTGKPKGRNMLEKKSLVVDITVPSR
jgi:hypothetical protein